jgi:DnaJ-class molecular chaperone
MDGDQYAVACDAYSRVRDNCRTVGLYVREKRKMSTRPVTTGEAEFANARLPSGEADAVAADPPPHDVLGVEPDASPETVREAYRERVQEVHPDKPSGDEERFKRVKRARQVMTDG